MDPAGNPATGTAQVRKRSMAEVLRAASSWTLSPRVSPPPRRRCGCGNGVGKGARRYPPRGRELSRMVTRHDQGIASLPVMAKVRIVLCRTQVCSVGRRLHRRRVRGADALTTPCATSGTSRCLSCVGDQSR